MLTAFMTFFFEKVTGQKPQKDDYISVSFHYKWDRKTFYSTVLVLINSKENTKNICENNLLDQNQKNPLPLYLNKIILDHLKHFCLSPEF